VFALYSQGNGILQGNVRGRADQQEFKETHFKEIAALWTIKLVHS
jgi:hypothetical protein